MNNLLIIHHLMDHTKNNLLIIHHLMDHTKTNILNHAFKIRRITLRSSPCFQNQIYCTSNELFSLWSLTNFLTIRRITLRSSPCFQNQIYCISKRQNGKDNKQASTHTHTHIHTHTHTHTHTHHLIARKPNYDTHENMYTPSMHGNLIGFNRNIQLHDTILS